MVSRISEEEEGINLQEAMIEVIESEVTIEEGVMILQEVKEEGIINQIK